jgi:nitroreductase
MTSKHDALRARFGDSSGSDDDSSFEQAGLTGWLERRTCRRYSSQSVPQSLLDALLDVALCASSKSDYQQCSVIDVRDAQRRRKIADLVPAMPWIGAAPAFLVFCADAQRLERISELRERPTHNRNLEAFFNASIDAALVMQTFILAAEQAGLGCCPISAIRLHLAEMRTILALPDRVVPIAGLCVGFPADRGFVSMRLPRVVTRHVDRYENEHLRDAIDGYDRRRAAVAPTPRDKQRNPDRFGYADFYGWSEDKVRQLAAGEGADFGAQVRACGFTLD